MTVGDQWPRRGRCDRSVVLNDIAPTLATILGIETPSGSTGQALPTLDPEGSRPPFGRTAAPEKRR